MEKFAKLSNLLVFIYSSIDDIEDNSLLRRGVPGKQNLVYTEYSFMNWCLPDLLPNHSILSTPSILMLLNIVSY